MIKKTSAVAKRMTYNKYKYTTKTENELNVFTFKRLMKGNFERKAFYFRVITSLSKFQMEFILKS